VNKLRACANWVWAQHRAAAAFVWTHRTKAIGLVGSGASYAYFNQDKLGLLIRPRELAFATGILGGITFAVGLYNTFFAAPAP
jgi:hypothetical protein